MPRVENILRVLDAFRRLDRVWLKFVSPSYPGSYHSVHEIVKLSGLPRSTVYDVLNYLQQKGVVDRKFFSSPSFKLLAWSFSDGSLTYVVELDRVVATLSHYS